MRIGLLPSLTLALASLLSSQAHASSDDICYPTWSLVKNRLDACSNLVSLNPGNDSRVNLRLLLADLGSLPLAPRALSEDNLTQGFGPVPFDLSRLSPVAADGEQNESAPTDNGQLNTLLAGLQVRRESDENAGDQFLYGEGSRCRSNSETSALAFVEHVTQADLPQAEQRTLAQSRVNLLTACQWDTAQQGALLPTGIESATGKAFATYLQGAADFYSGRFAEASQAFTALKDSSQPWLKETASYMAARTLLNQAQQNAFDEYGWLKADQVDQSGMQQAEAGLVAYLDAYPQGVYSVSAKGLLRRTHWLSGNTEALAKDYAWQLAQKDDNLRNQSLDELVEEVDNKLLMSAKQPLQAPLLLAVKDLMAMRSQPEPSLTRAALLEQQASFAQQPVLYAYLQAAFSFYVEQKPDATLKQLPTELPASLDYLAFSQQTLRGLALEAKQDWKAAAELWQQLLPLATLPLQRQQLELALAMNYERSGQLAKVFAADSPIGTSQVRALLLRQVAGTDLLRQQAEQASDPVERSSALFVLLYKDLMRGQYAAFAEDLQRLPTPLPQEKLGANLGYVYNDGPSLALFSWHGEEPDDGYRCPNIATSAAALQLDPKNPQGLNCLGDFIRRNDLDGMPLDQQPEAGTLGSTASAFKGKVFSRLDGYQQVINNPKAPRNDRAYALYRGIYCYASSGNNRCGGAGVEPAVRKAWFRQLKGSLGDTQWAQSLRYYW